MLHSELPYMRERFGLRDKESFSIGEVDNIINNSCYSFEERLYPEEIYKEWQKVFLYAAALEKEEWDIPVLRKVYERFLDFMRTNICEVIRVEGVLIDKETYYRALLLTIREMQKYLQGEDCPVISRDLWILLNSRYSYLPYIQEYIFRDEATEIFANNNSMPKRKALFESQKMNQLIRESEAEDTYQKGIKWEEAAEYFLACIQGVKITGRRVKTVAQEIDFSIANISVDQKLWEMGAYILAECKNWKDKVGIGVIRGLSHISELKGNKTTILFTANGITRNAEEEILRLTASGKYILNITKADLQNAEDEQWCYNLLVQKWEELKEKGGKHELRF